jgi:hypothetical protein
MEGATRSCFGDGKAPLSWYEGPQGRVPETRGEHGAGDVNGDGRNDIVTPSGWFEAPPDPRVGHWTYHADGIEGFLTGIIGRPASKNERLPLLG